MSNFRIYNDTLCPDLWDSYQHLDPRVRLNLLRMAYDFHEKTKFPAPIIDVYLMGSIANYNWTPESDADVHVMIDYTKLNMPEKTDVNMVKTVSANWNLEHKVFVKNHKVEMNFQNIHEKKPHVTGIYSLVTDKWIRTPVKMNANIDKMEIQTKYAGMKKYIDSAINSGDREIMKSVKEYVDAFRQYGLDTRGELSTENIIFKILRAKGVLKALKDAITAAYDSEMTVAEKTSLFEVTQSDLKSNLPKRAAHNMPMHKFSLDNLNALKEKAARFYKYYKDIGQSDYMRNWKIAYDQYDAEIKKRLKYINKPVLMSEMPQMSLQGKSAYAGSSPLKGMAVEDVWKNIVMFRNDKPGIFSEGFTILYFMDSEESAQDIIAGKIPYLMIPRGTFHQGGSPITDVWKAKFQKPGTEHILGLIEGSTTDEEIYIDMISVRSKWKRNHIAKLMLGMLKKRFPNATLTTSDQTDQGSKFFKGVEKKEKSTTSEGYGMGDPTKDPKAVGRWTVKYDSSSSILEDQMYKQTPKPDQTPKTDANVGRIQFTNPGAGISEFPPIVNKMITEASKVLDKKTSKGEKFFTVEYVLELLEDIIVSSVSDISNGSDEFKMVQQVMLLTLARDYDIRKNGHRILE